MENLNAYLAATCYTLINVSKDYFYKELHSPVNQATLRSFAIDKKLRTLVVARIDRPTAANIAEGTEEVKGGEENNGGKEDSSEDAVEILFTVKVQFLGQMAQSIAFVKREAHAQLELKAAGESVKPLASQLQLLNLGYVGEDSNIFELAVNYVEYSFIPLFSTYKTSSSSSAL